MRWHITASDEAERRYDAPAKSFISTKAVGKVVLPAHDAEGPRREPTMSTRTLFRFPDPVNEVSARLVAAGVAVMCLTAIVFDQPWLIAVIAYGFVARVCTGPTLSPLGQFVTRVLTPRLPFTAKYVPGPPKRFAQGIGATLSIGAVIAAFVFGARGLAYVFLGGIVIAATLESVFGYCLGCTIFGALMRAGIIPASVCERCNDIWGATSRTA
jgi:hypothetical protein